MAIFTFVLNIWGASASPLKVGEGGVAVEKGVSALALQ